MASNYLVILPARMSLLSFHINEEKKHNKIIIRTTFQLTSAWNSWVNLVSWWGWPSCEMRSLSSFKTRLNSPGVCAMNHTSFRRPRGTMLRFQKLTYRRSTRLLMIFCIDQLNQKLRRGIYKGLYRAICVCSQTRPLYTVSDYIDHQVLSTTRGQWQWVIAHCYQRTFKM